MVILKLLWFLFYALLLETAPDGDDDADTVDDDDEPDPPDPPEVRDPEKKALSDEAKTWRLRLRKAEAKVKELEEGAGATATTALRTSMAESAFLRAVLASDARLDVETAWDLLKARGFFDTVKFADDGTVTGMDAALARVLDRYPWLADPSAVPEPDPVHTPPKPSTGTGHKKKDDGALDDANLQNRFPALKRRGR